MPIRRRCLSHGLPISTAHRFEWHVPHAVSLASGIPGWVTHRNEQALYAFPFWSRKITSIANLSATAS